MYGTGLGGSYGAFPKSIYFPQPIEKARKKQRKKTLKSSSKLTKMNYSVPTITSKMKQTKKLEKNKISLSDEYKKHRSPYFLDLTKPKTTVNGKKRRKKKRTVGKKKKKKLGHGYVKNAPQFVTQQYPPNYYTDRKLNQLSEIQEHVSDTIKHMRKRLRRVDDEPTLRKKQKRIDSPTEIVMERPPMLQNLSNPKRRRKKKKEMVPSHRIMPEKLTGWSYKKQRPSNFPGDTLDIATDCIIKVVLEYLDLHHAHMDPRELISVLVKPPRTVHTECRFAYADVWISIEGLNTFYIGPVAIPKDPNPRKLFLMLKDKFILAAIVRERMLRMDPF
ncbi:hypothetical protein PCE1_002401 [Barthelona sp. PCE]